MPVDEHLCFNTCVLLGPQFFCKTYSLSLNQVTLHYFPRYASLNLSYPYHKTDTITQLLKPHQLVNVLKGCRTSALCSVEINVSELHHNIPQLLVNNQQEKEKKIFIEKIYTYC